VTNFISPLDSLRFGYTIAKVNEAAHFKKKDFLPLLKEQGVQLIISRINSERIDDINLLEDIGFRVKDMQVTYSFDFTRQPINPVHTDPAVLLREAGENDIPALSAIAGESFDNYGHYFNNARLDKTRCREIYPDWLRRSILDPQVADKVFMAEYKQQPAGFLSFKVYETGALKYAVGVQGAVAQNFRGKNIFSALTVKGLLWGKETSLIREEHNVHTANYPVNRVFSKLGFSPIRAFTTLHYWTDGQSV
jgi:hypothetical protein